MIKHYIKIAIRNLAQHKVLTGINIFGLSVGIACFSLFLLYTVHEFSYDRFHKNSDRIFRVVEWWQGANRTPGGGGWSYTPMAAAMKKDFPDVAYAVRMKPTVCFSKTDNKVFRTSITYADIDFFNIFSFPLLYGNRSTALSDPHHIVVTKEKALQLFGTTNTVGKMVQIKTDSAFEPFIISAVADNVPANSSIKFDILCAVKAALANPIKSLRTEIELKTYKQI